VYHLAPASNKKEEIFYYQHFTEQNFERKVWYFVPFSIFAGVKATKTKVV